MKERKPIKPILAAFRAMEAAGMKRQKISKAELRQKKVEHFRRTSGKHFITRFIH